MPAKNRLFPNFLAYYFLKVHLHHSSKTKVIKKSQSKSRFFLLSMLDDGRIRIQIRISTNNRIRRIRRPKNLTIFVICIILNGGADPDPYAWVSIIVCRSESDSLPVAYSHQFVEEPDPDLHVPFRTVSLIRIPIGVKSLIRNQTRMKNRIGIHGSATLNIEASIFVTTGGWFDGGVECGCGSGMENKVFGSGIRDE
jgi:hypothetical protein